MERRAYKRFPSNLLVRLHCADTLHYGIATNLSENGMCIKTGISLPSELSFMINVPFKQDVLKVPARVNRLVQSDGFYDGFGVEILDPPENYSEFLSTINSAL